MRLTTLLYLLTAVILPWSEVRAEGLTVEFFVDTDPGIGQAMKLGAKEGGNQFSIPLGNYSAGAHIFGVRAVSENGMCSPTVTHPVYITDEQLYDDMEYFVDDDPGEGKGLRPNHDHAEIVRFEVDTDNLSLGTHTMNVRVKGGDGKWSAIMTRPFIVFENIGNPDFILEYFYDNDPGIGNGSRIAVAEGRNSLFLPVDSSLSAGAHLMGIRCRDKDDNWSITEVCPLFIVPVFKFERLEYYVDNDPGEGFANSVAVDDEGKASFAIKTDDLSIGSHRLNLRGKDLDGDWHILFSREFNVLDKDGVDCVTWSAGLRLSMTGGILTVLPSGFSDETLIEVYTLDGRLINQTRWQNAEDVLNIKMGTQTCLIVRAIQPDGYFCVETIR